MQLQIQENQEYPKKLSGGKIKNGRGHLGIGTLRMKNVKNEAINEEKKRQ